MIGLFPVKTGRHHFQSACRGSFSCAFVHPHCKQLVLDFSFDSDSSVLLLSGSGETDSVHIYSTPPPPLIVLLASLRRQASSVARVETSHVWPVSVAASVSVWSCRFL